MKHLTHLKLASVAVALAAFYLASVWPGAFDDPVAGVDSEDVDEATNAAVAAIFASAFVSSQQKSKAIELLGRLCGETLAHEIVHSLIGPPLTGGAHNVPGVERGLMNRGMDRSLTDRTGFEIIDPAQPVTLDNLRDIGTGHINIPLGDAQAEIDKHFPVVPPLGGLRPGH